MFSNRVASLDDENEFTRLLIKKKGEGARLFDLSISNPTVLSEIQNLWTSRVLPSLTQGKSAYYQAEPQGDLAARQAITDYYSVQSVNAGQIFLCASTSEAYSWLFQILCDAGERVLCPQPSYPLFEHLAMLSNVTTVPYSFFYDGRWNLDVASLESADLGQVKALIVVHPNNPTGTYMNAQEVLAVVEFCKKHHLALIVDEVFKDYSWVEHGSERFSWLGLGAEHGVLTFILSGFSKVLGLPQVKLGWICVDGTENQREQASARLEFVADTFLSVSGIAQESVPTLLGRRAEFQAPILNRIRKNARVLQTKLRGTACECLAGEAGFSMIVRLPRLLTEEQWVLRFLQDYHVVVYPGYFFDFSDEPYVVVSLLPSAEDFAEGVDRMIAAVEGEMSAG